MKKINSLIALAISIIGFSQTILNQSETTSRTVLDPQAVIMLPGFHASSATVSPFIAKIGDNVETGGTTDSGAGAANPSGTLGSNSFHDTQGNIEVNGGGQLQFTLPIALPPGIKSVAPQINLGYTSGTGNGIAGYGWNLSGITSISRMSKTIEKDGEIKGIQLNNTDNYSFNGQRLILKSGTNGGNSAEYVTEKYSNVKIKSLGIITGQTWEGPEYWEVTFEDGSQAWYGGTTSGISNARTPIEYNIVKWKDAQGNYITYNYTQSNNVALISSIQWGGNETIGKAHFNQILFNYSNRDYKETSYIKGINFVQDKILSNIVVNSNNTQFKKYEINYTKSYVNNDQSRVIGYQFVDTIKEYNSQNEAANPVTFSSNPLVTKINESNFGDYENVIASGDYNGDGLLDFIVKQPAQEGKPEGYYVYFDVMNSSTPNFVRLGTDSMLFPNSTSSNPTKEILTVTLKSNDNIVKTKQGILTIGTKRKTNFPDDHPPIYDIVLNYYSIRSDSYVLNNPGNPSLVLENSKILDYYDFKFSPEIYPDLQPPDYYYVDELELSSYINSKEIDIDSDGISEMIFSISDRKCYNRELASYPEDILRWECEDAGTRYMVIDTDDIQNNSFHMTEPMNKNIIFSGLGNRTSIMDFDNDGKVDIMYANPSSDSYTTDVSFFTKNSITGSLLNKTYNTPLTDIDQYVITKENNNYIISKKKTYTVKGLYKGILFGDLNGDKNIEILMPIHEAADNQDFMNGWSIYLNDGLNLHESIQGLAYYRSQTYTNKLVYNNANLIDIDNDGKSELVNSVAHFSPNNSIGTWWLYNYKEFKYNPNDTQFKWSYTFEKLHESTRNQSILTPIFGDFRINLNNSKILCLVKGINNSERKLISYYHYNLGFDKNITSIKQGELTTSIIYKELNSSVNPNFYAPVKQEQYPYVELDNLGLSFAVSQLIQEKNKQDFRYRGLVTHLQGKGMIGFRQTARSSWYTDDFVNTKTWSGAEIDPLNEGLPIKEWSIKTNTESQIFPTDISESNTQLLSFKSTQYKIDKLLNGNIVDINAVSAADKPKIVTAIVPTQSRSKNFLSDVTTESTITYGNYYLPQQTVVRTNNDYAINTTTLEYVHNINGSGKDYYVGRPQSKIETVYYSPANDTKSAKQEYTYNANNLLETLKTWNRNDSGWFLETYTYDGFGNITQKVITNSIDANSKTDHAEYDAKGRFVLKKTDNLNLETHITYNDWGQVLTQTDPLGNTLTNTYDNWGKLLTSKTNLGGTTTYTYEKATDGDAIISEYAPDGGKIITYTNKFGQKYKSVSKAFGQNRYVASEVRFDGLGRKIKESEPYFDGATPSQWNTIEYDDYSRPVKATAFTGKIMQTAYGTRSVRVVETNANNRFKEQKTDPVGKVISTEDLGGIITFKYNAAGENTEADYEGNTVKTSYDAWGNKIRFEDPSNGVYEYKYLGYFGTLSESKSPKGKKEYEYNDKGQLTLQKEKSDVSGETDKTIAIKYNNKGQVVSKTGTSLGKSYSSSIAYDANGRVLSTFENSNGKYYIQKDIVYDDKSRVTSYEKSLYSSGVLTKADIQNVYDTWSGQLYQVKDKNADKILWELQDANAKGQVTQAKLGGININNSYDSNGFLNNISHISAGSQATVLQVSYSFNAIKNELNSRTTGGDFNIMEQFQYDDNNRLYNWTNPVTGAFTQNQKRNEYDKRGRIIRNDQLGTVKFDKADKIYQATGLTLNAEGEQNYNNDLIQSISYNENNDPIYIDGAKGDARFEYGLTNMRQVASYGGNFDPDSDGKFTKYYSEDGSYEVIKNNETGQEKHLIYIGGTPYEANIVYLKNYTESSGSYKFLHKDYLGSILAITDEAGNKLEQRHFDAWGNLTHLKIGTQAIITDQLTINNYELIINRGYTSHEHFAEIGIIHMNGRLYDPLLRRFLNADENIQDPNNTQNYNKYGYVLNNPLMYNDPSGEIFFFAVLAPVLGKVLAGVVAGAIAGSIVGAATYMLHAAVANSWSWSAFGKSILMGAVSGAITGGMNPGVFSAAAGTLYQMGGQVLASVLPSYDFTILGVNFSISPSIALGKGWGFGANITATIKMGDWSLSYGAGIMAYGGYAGSGLSGTEYRRSVMMSYDDGKFGLGLGSNRWDGLHPQTTGIAKMRYGDFGFTYENDGKPFSGTLGDGGDSYRTAAASISIGDFSVGTNLFTGLRDKDSYDNWENNGKWDLKEGELGLPVIRKGIKYKYGLVYEKGTKYRMGAFYFGYKNYRFGVDSDRHVRHSIQNRWIHNSNFAAQRAFEVIDFSTKPYLQYRTSNIFTSW